MNRSTMNKTRKIIHVGLIVISLVYIAVLLKIVLLKSGIHSSEFRHVQYIPFAFIKDFFAETASVNVLLKNVLGNFTIFIPLGILLPCMSKKLSFWKTVIIGFAVSLGFELIQYITGFGMTDIDDLILNTLGALAGVSLYTGVFKKFRTSFGAELAALLFLTIFGCCGVLSLWLYSSSMLMLPEQVEYVNQEVLGGVDKNSYDISAECIKIENNIVYLKEDTLEATQDTAVSVLTKYSLTDGALLIIQDKVFQYSSNGNVQNQIISYSVVSENDANITLTSKRSRLQEKLWINEKGECYMLMLTVMQN